MIWLIVVFHQLKELPSLWHTVPYWEALSASQILPMAMLYPACQDATVPQSFTSGCQEPNPLNP